MEGERGALPLLAFAMARLWEKRDRENGLLTRQAYHDIGGVGGALARHAEETMERIGAGRVPIVRELFRNLVTAEGTRAVREVTSCCRCSMRVINAGQLSRSSRELIDARLLTSYEVQEEDERAYPPSGDHPRVLAGQLAAAGALADPGPGRGAAAGRAAPGGPLVGRARAAR